VGKQYQNQRVLLALAVVAGLSEWTGAAAQGVDVNQFKDQILVLINEQRAVNGLPALQRVAALDAAAQSYSETMMRATAGGSVYLAHVGPDGSTLEDRVSDAGYDWYSLGEDLAAGQTTPEQVVAEWMSSPQHRDNILNPDFGDAGVGIAIGPGTWPDGYQDPQVLWWTVDLGEGVAGPGQPNASQPPPSPSVTGYTALDGTPVSGAPFGSLLLISGQNLGLTGSIAFHGRPTSALSWTSTSILAIVPLQFFYPDTGPVTVTLPDRTAVGPNFTTQQPAYLRPPPPPAPHPGPGPSPAASPPASSPGIGGAPSAPSPTIHALVDGKKQPLATVRPGGLFFIHGSGFGSNPLRPGRVLFTTAFGTQIDGAIWDWSDNSIAVFAPSLSGPAQVAVQVAVNGMPVTSNRVPLTIQ
jgi:uncharacterized protein YkwD